MIREWASNEQLERIEDALTPPIGWRDPDSGLPAGFTDDEDA